MKLKHLAARGVSLLLSVLPVLAKAAEETGHGAESGHAGGGIAGQLHLDGPVILAQAVGFLVMFFILWRLVFRRVGSTLDARRDDIAARLAKIEEDQAASERARRETEQRLAEVEREARHRLEEAAERADLRRAEILAEARSEAEQQVQRAQERIERETDAAVLALRAEVADLVVEATRQILDESLDEARQRRIVDDMIGRLPQPSDAEA